MTTADENPQPLAPGSAYPNSASASGSHHGAANQPSHRGKRPAGAAASELSDHSELGFRVLIVDDELANRGLYRTLLEADGYRCDEAENGAAALTAISGRHYDLALLDIDMPGILGTEVLRRLRHEPPYPHLKIIMLSGRATGDELAELIARGADDYLCKPFSIVQFRARIKATLRRRNDEFQSDRLNRNLVTANQDLAQQVLARDHRLIQARDALVLAMAELVRCRDAETGAHIARMQRYCRCLAETAAQTPRFSATIDENFTQILECSAPLHDIGKAGVPDHVLLKPGLLSRNERIAIERHTTMGADTLRKVARQQGFAPEFLQMAVDVAQYHHERYDGHGYPSGLAGDNIPLAARIVAIADVYDALRSQRVYKAARTHHDAIETMEREEIGRFDPTLFESFLRCASKFDLIFESTASPADA